MKYILLFFMLVTVSLANIAKISTVVGDAKVQRGSSSIPINVGLEILEKDIVYTKDNSKVQLIFKDNTIITLGKNSSLNISEYLYDPKTPKNSKANFNFFKGAFKTITGKIGKINREKFKLRTKNATIGIRGTIVLGNQQFVACTQGAITVESFGQEVDVEANEITIIEKNKPPTKPKTITKEIRTTLENQVSLNENNVSNISSDTSSNIGEIPSNDNENNINNDVENTNDEVTDEAIEDNEADNKKVFLDTINEIEVASNTVENIKNTLEKQENQTKKDLEDIPTSSEVLSYSETSENILTQTNTKVEAIFSIIKKDLGLDDSSIIDNNNNTPENIKSLATSELSKIQAYTNDLSIKREKLKKVKDEVLKAENHLERSKNKIDTVNLSIKNAKQKKLNPSYINKLESRLKKAENDYKKIQSLYTSIKSEYEDKQKAIDSLDKSLSNAQQAYNQASFLVNIDSLKTLLSTTSTANTNSKNAKNLVLQNTNLANEFILNLTKENETTTLKTNSQNAKATTKTSINKVINTLQTSTSSSDIDNTSLIEVSQLVSNSSLNTTLLSNVETLKNTVDTTENKNKLDNAKLKLDVANNNLTIAKTNYDLSTAELQKVNSLITLAKHNDSNALITSQIENSFKQKVQDNYNQARQAYETALEKYNNANSIYTDRKNAYDNVQLSINDAQEAVNDAKILKKLSDILNLVDTSNKATSSAFSFKSVVDGFNQEAKEKIQTLPQSSEVDIIVGNSTRSLNNNNTTQESLSQAINSAVQNSSINTNTLENLQNEILSRKTSSNTILVNANTFKSKVTEGIYKNKLDEISNKVASALIAKNNANNKYLESKTAYENMLININTLDSSILNSSLSTSLINKLKNKKDEAKIAYDNALIAYNEIKDLFYNKNNELNTKATKSVDDAQKAVDTLTILDNLEDVLESLEDSKKAKTDVNTQKNIVLTAKTNTSTAVSNAQTSSTSLVNHKESAINAKTQAVEASNILKTSFNTAKDQDTTDVQVAYSAKIVQDQALLVKEKSDLAKEKSDLANTAYTNLISKVTQAQTQLSTALNAKNQTVEKLETLKDELDELKVLETKVSTASTTAKASVQSAVQKAQQLYDLALQEKEDAILAYNEAKALLDNLSVDTFKNQALANKNEANSAYNLAKQESDTAQANATESIQLAQTASLNVKNKIIASSNKSEFLSNDTPDSINLQDKVFELSSVKTNEKLLTNPVSTYKGHSQLGVFKESSSSTDPLYLVQADNLLEYFVSYSSSSNASKTLFTYGVDNSDNFNTSKTYIYKSFKTLIENNDGTRVLNNDETIAYYNPKTGSFTQFKKDIYSQGATTFVARKKDLQSNSFDVVFLENKFNYNGSNNEKLTSIDTFASKTASNIFYGSIEQGLTQKFDIKKGTADSYTKLNTSFLSKQETAKDINSSKTLIGDTVFIANFNIGSTAKTGDVEIKLNKIQSYINIHSTISYNSDIQEDDSTLNLFSLLNVTNQNVYLQTALFGGNVSEDGKAYYINDDIFGARVLEADTNQNGIFIAVPDGGYNSVGEFVMYDEEDNPFMSDDGSSWGYWASKEYIYLDNNTASTSPLSTWVAGEVTNTSYMDQIMSDTSATQNLEFNGKVLGTIDFTNPILMDNTNKVKINLDIGGGVKNMTGNMQFKSATSNLYNIDLAVDSANITNSGFSGGFKPAGNPTATKSGSLSGRYYGGDSLKSIGGKFEYDKARGVFKATKK
ncbi:FecR domain-containing protein [Arcobacter sp. YIC-80]|uniref:FecR domain-containing protein n=1 Tax=Arcobacter sp. YIC-80 TaxID=3376683 RepID=UPI00384D08C5